MISAIKWDGVQYSRKMHTFEVSKVTFLNHRTEKMFQSTPITTTNSQIPGFQ